MITFGTIMIMLSQIFICIGLLILGFRYDLNILFNISAGMFFGMSAACFFGWKLSFKY